ncbi:hypothetical protein IFR05_002594 [Cadophora sp. M221]|nr:hypothetical protein IFR05_002594 [Cadophora sp. M221]
MTTKAEYCVMNFLTGLGVAPFKALIEVSISDIFFAHERGTKLRFYILSIASGSFLGPIASGYVAVDQGWRWIPLWGIILGSILLVVMLFLLDETKFIRERSRNETLFEEHA